MTREARWLVTVLVVIVLLFVAEHIALLSLNFISPPTLLACPSLAVSKEKGK